MSSRFDYRNRVYRLNLKNISLSGCEKNHLLLEPTESDVRDCISKGKTQVSNKLNINSK